MTNMLTIFGKFDNFWQIWQFLKIFENFENFWQFWQFLTILKFFDDFDNFQQCWWFSTIFNNLDHFWQFLQFDKKFFTIFTIDDNFHNSDNCFCHFDNWKDNPGDMWHLRHWLQFWQLRIWIHDNLCYLTINCDTGQHLQFLWCFPLNELSEI